MRTAILVNVNALHPSIVAGDRMDKLCREKAKKRGWTPEQVCCRTLRSAEF